MKRLLPALCFVVLASCVCVVPGASASWWHRHHKDSNNNAASKPPKAKKQRHHRHEKASHPADSASAMTNGPHSIGHWHPMPGPAGAGAR